MKLREFIKETLTEIAFGVHQAKVASKDLVAIAPGTLNGEVLTEKTYVDFDVAVTASEVTESGKDGKAGIRAEIEVLGSKIGGELSGGASKGLSATKETASRVSFKVPIFINANYRNDQGFAREIDFVNALSEKEEK
jgi:hypothetical protein